jgi:hypothetical protein
MRLLLQMKINYETIEHKKQRYDTVGDYWQDKRGTWQIRVSKMSDPRYAQLVLLHELTELTLVIAADIKIAEIDKFDFAYEAAGKKQQAKADCGCRLKDEPGDDPHAPYHKQHQAAMVAERAAAKAMGVDWKNYNDEMESL